MNLPTDWDTVTIIGVSDVHRGCDAFDEKSWVKFLKEVQADPRIRILLLGDLAHTATKESKSDVYKATMTLKEELDALEAELKPVTEQIIGVVRGNHERRAVKLDSRDPMEDLCKFLGKPHLYQGVSMAAKVTWGVKRNGKRQCLSIYAQHGFGGGKTKGAPANMLAAMTLKCPVADLYFGGHFHQPHICWDRWEDLDLQNSKRMHRQRMLVSTAAFVHYEEWLDEIGRAPAARVIPRVTFDQDKNFTIRG